MIVTVQFTIVMGDSNAKVGKKRMGGRSVDNFGIDSRNSREDTLMGFAETDNLRLVNMFFYK